MSEIGAVVVGQLGSRYDDEASLGVEPDLKTAALERGQKFLGCHGSNSLPYALPRRTHKKFQELFRISGKGLLRPDASVRWREALFGLRVSSQEREMSIFERQRIEDGAFP